MRSSLKLTHFRLRLLQLLLLLKLLLMTPWQLPELCRQEVTCWGG